MENVDTSKRFDALDLTRSEERLLRHVTGLRRAELAGRLERIFHSPWGPSLDVMIALNTIAIYATVRSADVVMAITFPLMFIIFCLVLSRRNRLINKLYRALEAERERSAPTGAMGP